MCTSKQLRIRIEEHLQRGQWSEAHVNLGDLWRREAKAATAGFISLCYDGLRGRIPLTKYRVSFLRSMTLEPLIPILTSAAIVAGIDITTHVGQFGSYAQEILDPESSLYSFDPDLVFLAVQTRDILPELWEAYTDLSRSEIHAAVDRALEGFATWIRAFRHRSKACLVVHTLERPNASAGLLGVQESDGQVAVIDRFNAELRKICNEYRGIYILDYDALIARHGRMRWHDEGKWLTLRMPFATDSLLPMVSEWLRFIHPLSGMTCKVLAVDLDNTLWGGVLGEDGQAGLLVGSEYPGAFYRSLQRVILDLYHRGILLAVCSKNNRDEAMAALQSTSGMLLKPEHFAVFRINWQDKVENLREIAAELNVGTDAIAFLDDNPVERDRVRTAMPEVKVLALPDHPQGFAAVVRDCPFFERLSLSTEDRQHTRFYHEQQQRVELAQNVGSLEGFYRSLEQEISIMPVTAQTLARVAQLTQKTNQFNVTTRRHSEQVIEEFAAQPNWKVYSVRVKDRFGDNGIVGVLITRMNGNICEIETFLLSCRVIGRTIETAMLGFLAENSRAEGAEFLQGWFVPTQKNTPVRELYPSHQFEPIATRGSATLWSLNLAEAEISQPEWIRLCVPSGGRSAERARA
jgi:FkbH-like protein